ncbi:alpha/beta hydrolase [Rhizobium sp. NZLR10]|uniref:alpha/beta fold hydrolase n=1 Tax=Rhizobium sp. NZLR10 TaxID=2731097 RepID=UPI001C828BCF|nr:alpha/beta hydrolase [Rhizobium sp. NZLR10]MBX5199202.1 alpha/beta hydrolase [Rhizobium sp. NZLR10]
MARRRGSEDHLSSRASNEEIAKLFTDAEVSVIEDAGHLLPFEQPQELTVAILQWFVRKKIELILKSQGARCETLARQREVNAQMHLPKNQ